MTASLQKFDYLSINTRDRLSVYFDPTGQGYRLRHIQSDGIMLLRCYKYQSGTGCRGTCQTTEGDLVFTPLREHTCQETREDMEVFKLKNHIITYALPGMSDWEFFRMYGRLMRRLVHRQLIYCIGSETSRHIASPKSGWNTKVTP